jgi:hypothetical protein
MLAYETNRESWYLINRTSSSLMIGDLNKLPVLKPDVKVDVLRYHSREEVSFSPELAVLISNGSVEMVKRRLGGNEEVIPASEAYTAITPSESYQPDSIKSVEIENDAVLSRHIADDQITEDHVNASADFSDFVKDRYYLHSSPNIRYRVPDYIHTFGEATGSYTKIGGSSAAISSVSTAGTFKCGTASIKVLSNSVGSPLQVGVFKSFGQAIDLAGKSIRLRYYINYTNQLTVQNQNNARLLLHVDSTYNGNYVRMNIPCVQGWNTVELDISQSHIFSGTGTTNSTLFQGVTLNMGASTPANSAGYSGDYIIVDLFEIWDNGVDRAYVCIQMDDGFLEQFDEMIPYMNGLSIPSQVYISPEKIGTGTVGSFSYADWDQVKETYLESDVLVSAHYGTYTLATNVSDADLEAWIINTKKELVDRGFLRGSDYFAFPGGQSLSLRDMPALYIFQKYFVHLRGTSAFLTPVGQYSGETTEDGFYPLCARNPHWGTAIQILSTWQTYVDKAIRNKSFLSMYVHGLNERSAGYWGTTRAQFRACMDYLKEKRDEGDLEIVTYEDFVHGKLPYYHDFSNIS